MSIETKRSIGVRKNTRKMKLRIFEGVKNGNTVKIPSHRKENIKPFVAHSFIFTDENGVFQDKGIIAEVIYGDDVDTVLILNWTRKPFNTSDGQVSMILPNNMPRIPKQRK